LLFENKWLSYTVREKKNKIMGGYKWGWPPILGPKVNDYDMKWVLWPRWKVSWGCSASCKHGRPSVPGALYRFYTDFFNSVRNMIATVLGYSKWHEMNNEVWDRWLDGEISVTVDI
jgi:hypothetical protein